MVLNLLLQEFSVIKVAAKVNQSQPAISRMLRRLRNVLGDELLVRSGSKLVPTEWALAIRTPLREIMAHVSRIEIDTFDPETTEREFRIACADCIETSLLPCIVAKMISAGPRIRVKLRLIDPAYDVSRALEEGELDLAIDNSPNPPDQLRISALYSDDVVCMMRIDHSLANKGRIPLATYLAVSHLAPHPSSIRNLGPIDGELAKIGYRRTIAATVPEFNMAPYVLTRTDLIFTTGRLFAEHYARLLPLRIVPAPSELPPMKFYQLWHERSHISASNLWLRQQILDVARHHLQPPVRHLANLSVLGR
jgi:DNA-binding transcriptional LysR family regulator